MSNPVFGSNATFSDPAIKRRGQKNSAPYAPVSTPGQLDAMYNSPAATTVDTGRLTYEDVIMKAGGLIALLVVVAAGAWVTHEALPGLYIVGAIVGFVLAMVNIFKKAPSPALIVAYTIAEGVFLGGLSAMLDRLYPGVALQALLATGITFAVTLFACKSGKIRASAKATKIFTIIMLSYFAFSLINVGVMIFGSGGNQWGLRGGEIFGFKLGVIIGIVAVCLAAYSLVLDFDSIQRGVIQGAPKKFAWTAAFGLIVTLVWLYVEFLRIFAILSGRD